LGGARFRRVFSHIEELQAAKNVQQIVTALLTTVYQSTRQSSQTTKTAARKVAEVLGTRHLEFDVDALVERYVEMVSKQIGRTLSWDTDDLALQNIQARVRGPGVWLVANERNALLLVTSNRSEAAVGYATMDGDTCGGLCPIGGIDKAFLRQWLRWLETIGPAGLHPLPVLALVNQQVPTAELRPKAQRQTDETDLMPYEILDVIERLAIRDKKSPLEIFPYVREACAGRCPDKQCVVWIERFFRLWCRNQWKRERYAPAFHLDDENLDPKTWCRFPILSGNYERELQELRAQVRRPWPSARKPAKTTAAAP
jgi:NAD+ synthase (glutamine-hydrolysing)